MVDTSISTVNEDIDALTDDYLAQAQPFVDDVSQRLFDMASGELLYDAIAQNVQFLMAKNVQTVESPRLGERRLKPLRFRLLEAETQPDLSKPVLTSGDD